jgi:predicted RND superfamily exporter protein
MDCARMNGFFQKRDPWGHGLALWVLAGLAFLAPVTVWSLRELRLENSMQSWLPANHQESQVYQWFRDYFPDEQRVIVSWEGSTLKDPRIQRLAEALRGTPGPDGIRRGGSPYVDEVYTPQDGIQRMVQYEVEPAEALRRLEGILIGQGWMKVRLTAAGRVEAQRSIRDLIEHAESKLGVDLTVHEKVTDWIDETYLAELDESEDAAAAGTSSGDALAPMIPEHDFQISWKGMRPDAAIAAELRDLLLNYRGFATAAATSGRQLVEECFFATGTPTAIAVTLSEAGGVEPDDAIRAIRWAAADCGIPEAALHIGGRAVTSAALNDAVTQVAWNDDPVGVPWHRRSLLLVSGLVGLVIAFFLLRSIKLGLMVVGIAWFATAVSLSVLPLTGTPMNMILVAMPTLLMVLAVSSAIHVVNYWRFAALEQPHSAVSRAVAMARQPCTLAALTTAAGMAALCVSPLAPVRQFGLFSAIGCVVLLVVVLYGLPALLQVFPARFPRREDMEGRGWKQYGLVVHRHWKLVGCACLLVSAACIAGLRGFRTETKVVRYFPPTSRLVQDYAFLEENLAGVTAVDIVVRFDRTMQERTKFLERLEIVRQVEDALCNHPEISGAVSLADFQPLTERPEPGARRQDVLKYLRRSQAVETAIKEDNAVESAALLVTAKLPRDLALPGDRGLNAAGDELWRISAQASIMTDIGYGDLIRELNERVQGVTRYHPGAGHVVTGTVPLFLRTQEAVLRSLIVTFVLAFVVMTGVMMWVLRDPAAGLLAMLPNLLPIAAVFGLLAWNGERIDIGTMVTASVALGIAVDGTLHLLAWFRAGLQRGQSRFRSVVEALAHCAPAMVQTCAAVGVGLLMLAPADLQLISRFGSLMASLVGAALLADLVLLPALLSGWLGAILERRAVAERKASQVAGTLPSPHLTLPRPQTPARQAG